MTTVHEHHDAYEEANSRSLIQQDVASMLLSVIGDHGFALAGAGAIREHALTDRPTTDVDLFGPPLTTAEQFAAVVELVEHTLSNAGYTVEIVRSFAQFARLRIIKDGTDVLEQLSRVVEFLPSEAAVYGIGRDDFAAIKERLLAWAIHIRNATSHPPTAAN